MKKPSEKIIQMVEEEKITPEDADELLRAISQNKGRWKRRLLNPFEQVQSLAAIIILFVVVFASVLVAAGLGVRYDSAIGVHMTETTVTYVHAIADQIVAVLSLALVLWLATLIVSKNGRFIDFLAAVGISRVPLLLLGLVGGLLFPETDTLIWLAARTPLHPALWIVALVAIVFVIWFFIWLFEAFKTASGLRKGRLAATFIIGVLAAETVSTALSFALPLPATVNEAPLIGQSDRYEFQGETHEQKAEEILVLWNKGQLDKIFSTFSDSMAAAITPSKLKWSFVSINWQIGELVKIESRDTQIKDGMTMVKLHCQFAKKPGVMTVVFDENDQVSGLWIRSPKSS